MRTFPQGETFGATFRGVDTTPVGSDAAFSCVVDFTGAIETRFPAPSIAVPVIAVHSQLQGSTFKVAIEGMWQVNARFLTTNAGAIALGVGLDMLPGQLNTDPFSVDGRLFDAGTKVGGPPLSVIASSGPRAVTRAMVADPALGVWRVIASNGNGVNAPMVLASVFQTNCSITFLRIGPLPAELCD